ncbi:MAG: aminotransferase class V-fold PLP-dependent enzyme, partial [Deltaproteobacteria bacterium]|nr:aminotransferase class V-fold PLP-dependent enzyme [Deltaproteobacteria bacterium]
GAGRLPNTLNCGFEGISAQSLITRLDLAGVAVSGGSACSSGASQPSPVLAAMGLSPARLEASFRISLGHGTTNEEIVQAGALLADQVRAIRKAAAGG